MVCLMLQLLLKSVVLTFSPFSIICSPLCRALSRYLGVMRCINKVELFPTAQRITFNLKLNQSLIKYTTDKQPYSQTTLQCPIYVVKSCFSLVIT